MVAEAHMNVCLMPTSLCRAESKRSNGEHRDGWSRGRYEGAYQYTPALWFVDVWIVGAAGIEPRSPWERSKDGARAWLRN